VDFRGHLRLPEDAGTGIPVLLRLDDIFVVISSGEDELGAWRADDVAIERIFSNQFAIELDGESMVFVAQDALGFAYDGITAIEDLQERLTKRRVFKRSKKKAKVEPAPVAEPAAAATPQPEVAEEPLVEAPAPTVEPEDEPVLAGEPKAIWSPPTAAPAPSPSQVEPEPEFEIAVPEIIQRRVEAEPPGPRPADVRVAYPQPSAPEAPAESVEPAAVASREVTPPAPQPTPEPPAALDAPSPVDPIPEPAEEPQPAAPEPSEPQPSDEPEPAPVADAPEFEIEEVSPAATGATWGDQTTVEVELDEPEIEIDEYVLPSAGAVDMFTAPAREVEDEEPEEAPADTPAAVEGRHLAEDDDAAPPEMPATEAPTAETADAETPEVEAPVEETLATDAPAETAVSSNGHSKSRKRDEGSQESKRERKHSLFGRSRDKKVPVHEHQYGDAKTIGGLTRQVCEVCGHVTFSGEDVYQGW
jgi:hypothetical protein